MYDLLAQVSDVVVQDSGASIDSVTLTVTQMAAFVVGACGLVVFLIKSLFSAWRLRRASEERVKQAAVDAASRTEKRMREKYEAAASYKEELAAIRDELHQLRTEHGTKHRDAFDATKRILLHVLGDDANLPIIRSDLDKIP